MSEAPKKKKVVEEKVTAKRRAAASTSASKAKTKSASAPVNSTPVPEPKERKKPGPQEKRHSYGPDFFAAIQELASAGYSDASIAYELADRFAISMSPWSFSRLKNEVDDKGEPTGQSAAILQALARGRAGILQAARSTYYQMALGQRKTKVTRRNAVQKRCPCCYEHDMVPDENCEQCGGTGWYYLTDKVITEESDMELAPNMQALATFLYNNDPEWRANILKMKREEAEAAAAASDGSNGLPTAVNIRITYNQKEDLALQEKFKKPSQ